MSDVPAPADNDELPPEGRWAVADVPWTVGDAIVVLVVWLASVVIIGGFVLFALEGLFPQTDPRALSLPITALFLVAVTTIYVRARYPGSVRKLIGARPPSLRAFGYGLAAGVVALVVFAFGMGTLLQFLADATNNELPDVQETFREIAADPTTAPLLIFGAIFIAPAAEELFYRGMLFPALRRRVDMWPAMGLSGGLWALSHLQSTPEGYLLVILIILPLGMFLAWLYERRQSLLTTVVAHATFNCVQVLLLVRSQGGL